MEYPTDIIIVGGGIAGLSTAIAIATLNTNSRRVCSRITVLESSSELHKIGAGITVPPNAARLLDNWGLFPSLEKFGFEMIRLRELRWENGVELTRLPPQGDGGMKAAFGYHWYQIHRADLHSMLLQRAKELDVEVHTGSAVVKYEAASSSQHAKDSVTTKDGRVFQGDLIVAADGAKSKRAEVVMGEKRPAVATGDSAYRVMLRRDQVEQPMFKDLELDKGLVMWLGPDQHVVCYPIRGGELYNMACLVPDDEVNEESWKLKGDVQKLRTYFEAWDPRLKDLLSMADETWLWSLRDRPALDRWLHPKGNMVLLGDSAHLMLPYMAQGAAMAIEDAAALAECLKFMSNDRPLRWLLDVYQTLRIPRTSKMQDAGRRHRDFLHMPDGPAQQARDAAFSNEANVLASATMVQDMYGYNVVDAVHKAMKDIYQADKTML